VHCCYVLLDTLLGRPQLVPQPQSKAAAAARDSNHVTLPGGSLKQTLMQKPMQILWFLKFVNQHSTGLLIAAGVGRLHEQLVCQSCHVQHVPACPDGPQPSGSRATTPVHNAAAAAAAVGQGSTGQDHQHTVQQPFEAPARHLDSPGHCTF